MEIIEKIEKAQEQTWWLPESAIIYEGEDHCYYKHDGKYFIVRFNPKDEDIEPLLSQIMNMVGSDPVRFIYMPHRHSEAIIDAFRRTGFVKNNCYEARAIHVGDYNKKPPNQIRAVMVQTFEEMRQVYEVRRLIFGGKTPEPAENIRRFLHDATSPESRVRQFLAIDQESGDAVSQAGMSLFHKLSFSFLFAGGTLKKARGRGSYTALVAARIAYARSVGIEHVGLFARKETSAPIVAKQGFTLYGEMQDWNMNWD